MIEPWVIVPALQKTRRSCMVCVQSRPMMKDGCAQNARQSSSCLGYNLFSRCRERPEVSDPQSKLLV